MAAVKLRLVAAIDPETSAENDAAPPLLVQTGALGALEAMQFEFLAGKLRRLHREIFRAGLCHFQNGPCRRCVRRPGKRALLVAEPILTR